MKAAQRIETETQLVPYSIEMAVVEELKTKYMDVTIPEGDKTAYAMVMGGLKECREIRLAVDGWHKSKKEWILKAGKHYDKEKNRVHALVEPVETHLKEVRAKEDDRIEAIKAEQVRIEQERVDRIRTRIAIMSIPSILNVSFKTATEVKSMLDKIADVPISPEDYQEFADEAARVKDEAIAKLTEMYNDRKRLEDEAERIEKVRKEQEAEAARLAAEKKAQEEVAAKIKAEQEAEAKRLDNLRKAEEEKVRKEREALEAEKRKIQEDKDRAEFERKAKIRAEAEAKAKVEREEQERKEREAKAAKEEADRKAAEALEKARQEALRPDKEKLIAWAEKIQEALFAKPELSDKSARGIAHQAVSAIQDEINEIKNQAEAL